MSQTLRYSKTELVQIVLPTYSLGSSIVQALAAQLNANVDVSDAGPGTAVTISHVEKASQRPALAIAAV